MSYESRTIRLPGVSRILRLRAHRSLDMRQEVACYATMLHVGDRTDSSDRKRQAGEWLADARRAAGLTQKELELAAGLEKGNLSNYERGVSWVPDEASEAIARALNKGVIETRRGLHLWVPQDATDPAVPEVDPLVALQRDTALRPDLRDHIVNQYKILREASQAAVSADDLRTLPHVARKRTPRKPRS